MDYKHTIDILIENIGELGILLSEFKKHEKIPAIEMDLALAKCRNLYDVLLLLKNNEAEDKVNKRIDTESAETLVEKDEKISNEKLEDEKTEITNFPEEVQSTELSENKEERESIPVNKNLQGTSEPKIVSDRFKKQPVSIHDNIKQEKHFQDITSKLQTKPISNLSNAIGLNEKYTFINKLFQGDAKKYEETLQVLNNASNFNEAYNFLIGNFDWDMDSELVQLILELIRRKLIMSKNE